jgi:MerR family redox-sensitive transcriptional activator SoxR
MDGLLDLDDAATLQVEAHFSSSGIRITRSCIAAAPALRLNAGMKSLRIGDVARAAGIAPSAIRYYEKCGLLPQPPRRSRQRCYDPEIIGYLEIIALAREAGMTIAEIRELTNGFPKDVLPSARWRSIAARKHEQLAGIEARVRVMRSALDNNFRCGCATFDDCARGLAAKRLGKGGCA